MKQSRTALLNSLSLAPERRSRWRLEFCCLCANWIEAHEMYRDRGYRRRAHSSCVAEAAVKAKEEQRTADALGV